ncbi:hypothetical protein DWQ65_04485 [Treponema phagedenis]|uniref:FecR domain-containing protein n=1 Tax=Treponema phagedenis TaxID=162 RepID=A0A0B7GVK9_TREPH|nr:FecR domain-containing protein [Treponema phagedenis]NVP22963.1 FecR domain-containing protein [Treponema phagedenis]QEJ95085.1 FecR domain-containing protein [Treponema phagedenis]QEJ98243.1 FecR domain-containing protein [Treponema phagedenis]QEK01010.1 FecR domain-containing protein [Treponema phagedenis]QEK03753.1 FecR domain-containing protein [Treponema phagedenis]
MKTKRNTKYNPKTVGKSSLDIPVIIFSLLLLCLSIGLLIRDLNRTFTRADKTMIATVNYKYKTVQRKFIDRAVWDRPLQNSPIYNGDVIRTAPQAAATIHFIDGSAIDMDSETMIQVFFDAKQASLNLQEGSISVETAGADIRLHSQDKVISLAKNSSLLAGAKEEQGLQLVMQKGEASIITEGEDEKEAEKQMLTEGSVFYTGEPIKLAVTNIANNAKILNQSLQGQGAECLLKWYSAFSDDEELILETSRASNFSSDVKKYSVTGLHEIVLIEKAGTVYWRLYSEKEGLSADSAIQGKFTVVDALPPQLLLPEQNALITYFEELPLIRFAWTQDDSINSYRLEVADNPEMQNPQINRVIKTTSIDLPIPNEGAWYWRVTPYYAFISAASSKATETAAFTVKKNTETIFPEIISPGAFTEFAAGQTVKFAWKNIPEAKKYRIQIADDKQMQHLLVNTTVTRNYFELEDSSVLAPNREYYWTIASITQNDKILSVIEPRKFMSKSGEIILRSLYPPDGYVLADTFCEDIRFTWKTNLDTDLLFQVSQTQNFDTISLERKVVGLGIDGIKLKQGDWYWRITGNTDDVPAYSEIKKLTIAEPLDKPELINARQTVVIAPNKKNKFQWQAIDGADYYQVKITSVAAGSRPFYENGFVTSTELELDLESLVEGNYVLNIQGFASPTLMSSRRYSLTNDHYCTFRHLKPIELVYPVQNAKINGLDALEKPILATWESMEKPINAELSLYKKGRKSPVFLAKDPAFKTRLPVLKEGTYTWKVTALTVDGFDISSLKEETFTVLPIPPLPAPRFFNPQHDAVMDVDYFKKNRTIRFSWERVRGATQYIITIYNNKNKVVATKIIPDKAKKRIEVNFKDIHLLSRGKFRVEVKAQNLLKDGTLFRNGKTSRLTFNIDLPKLKKIKTDDAGELYGN